MKIIIIIDYYCAKSLQTLISALTVFHSEVENNAKDLDGRHAIMQFDSMKNYTFAFFVCYFQAGDCH